MYGLRDGDEALGLKGFETFQGTEQEVFSYNNPWWQMDRHIKDYNERIKPLILHSLSLPGPGAALETLQTYNAAVTLFVHDIDRTVRILQKLSEKKIATFKDVEFSLLGLFLAIVAGAFCLAIFLIRRPLLEVLKGTVAFGRGDLDYRVPVKGHDEIGALARSFNSMAETIKKNIEELKLLHSKNMTTVGHLTNGIAHHINNPLSGINLCADFLLRKSEEVKDTPLYGELRTHLVKIKDTARRCETAIDGLLSISRVSNPERMPIMINRLVENSLRDITDKLKTSEIQLETELSPTVANTYCNHSLVKTVVLGLITNAIDSMPEGGRLVVKTSYLADEERVELTIQDTGPGISEKDLPHLFDPYFILKIKPSTRLTGLELALAQLTVQSLGGSIAVDSKIGEGTTFKVRLPVYKGAVSAGLAAQSPM